MIAAEGTFQNTIRERNKTMRCYIEMVDGLYCVYRREKIGDRIVSAHHTLKEAKEAIKKQKGTKQ